jgi:serine/threonine protein kinase
MRHLAALKETVSTSKQLSYCWQIVHTGGLDSQKRLIFLLTPEVPAVVQADLKGANVLLKSAALSNYDKRGYTCKLADFGLSRVMDTSSTHVSTSTFGTAA